jgi:hypothetical protein
MALYHYSLFATRPLPVSIDLAMSCTTMLEPRSGIASHCWCCQVRRMCSSRISAHHFAADLPARSARLLYDQSRPG